MRLPRSFIGVLLCVWLFALGLAALSDGSKNLGFLIFAAALTGLVDLAVLLCLAIWFFPRASRKLESPILGLFVGLPIFALLAAAVVLFFWATCYGVATLR